MENLLFYFLKSTIYLVVFQLAYMLFLRNSVSYVFNRFFLLTGLAVATLLPFFEYHYNVPLLLTYNIADSIATTPNSTEIIQNAIVLPILINLVAWGYLIGVIIVVCKRLFEIWKYLRLKKKSEIVENVSYKVLSNPTIKSPFSVFNCIFINADNLSKTEREIILTHEISHIKQYHWIDLICGECALTMQWFNPFYRFYMRLVKENHEYLADKAVLQHGYSQSAYQAVLINQSVGSKVFSFADSFSYINPLKRLKMMKKEKSSPLRKVAIVGIVPILGMFVFSVFAQPNYVIQNDSKAKAIEIAKEKQQKFDETFDENFNAHQQYLKAKQKFEKKELEKSGLDKYETEYKQSDEKLKSLMTVDYPIVLLNGSQVAFSTLELAGKMNTVFISPEDAVKKYGEKGKNGAIEIIMNDEIEFGDNIETSSSSSKNTTTKNFFSETNLLTFINGIEYPIFQNQTSYQVKGNLRMVFNLVKEKAIEKYGEKGKNGTLEITCDSVILNN